MTIVQPIIVLGMHRSGTSLMVQILERCDVFMGARQEMNHEALFFLGLNELVLDQSKATWDEPRNVKFLDSMVSGYLVKALELALSSDARSIYLGEQMAGLYSSIFDLDIPWGWKDPRNTWTANLWLTLFPGAKVIHVYRHPVDVAASLRHREQIHAEQVRKFIEEKGLIEFKNHGYRFQLSGRVKHLEGGFALWEQYVSEALSLEEKYPENFLRVRYEDLLDNSAEVLSAIKSHIGFHSKAAGDMGVSDLITGERALAFRNDPALCEFHSSISNNRLVVKLGYG